MFECAAGLAFHLVMHVNIAICVVNLAPDSVHFGVFADDHIGFVRYLLFRFYIRRNLDHTAHVHVVVPSLPVIGTGNRLVRRQYITLSCV